MLNERVGQHLVALPEAYNLGKRIDEAMKAVEAANPELGDVLPRGYRRLEKATLSELLRLFAPLPRKLSGDAFGLIYEDSATGPKCDRSVVESTDHNTPRVDRS